MARGRRQDPQAYLRASTPERRAQLILADIADAVSDSAAVAALMVKLDSDVVADSPLLASLTADPANANDRTIRSLIKEAAGCGADGPRLAREIAEVCVGYLGDHVDWLAPRAAAQDDQRGVQAHLERVRRAHSWVRDLLTIPTALERLANISLAARRRVDSERALNLMAKSLFQALVDGDRDLYRQIVGAAAEHPALLGGLEPVAALTDALASGELDDDRLALAARVARARDWDEPGAAGWPWVLAPWECTPLMLEGLGRDRMTGPRGLVMRSGRGVAPYRKLFGASTAPEWAALTRAALENPDVFGSDAGPRELFVPLVRARAFSEISSSLRRPSDGYCLLHKASDIASGGSGGRTEVAAALRITGAWEGVPVAVNAVVELGLVGDDVTPRSFAIGAIRRYRLPPEFGDAPLIEWSGDASAPLSGGPSADGSLAGVLARPYCRHAESRWEWNDADDAMVLVCHGCGDTRLACAPLHRLAEHRVAGPLEPPHYESHKVTFADHQLRRARYHAALAGEGPPPSWRWLVEGSEPIDRQAVRAQIIADATVSGPGRSAALRETLARPRVVKAGG